MREDDGPEGLARKVVYLRACRPLCMATASPTIIGREDFLVGQ
jgi:hypothetical protein